MAIGQADGLRAGNTGKPPVQLLDVDPSLGDGLAPAELATASRALPAPSLRLEPGRWSPPADPGDEAHLGYLVTAGLIVRRVEVSRGSSVELLGDGDLLRPWQEDASSFCAASWEVLEPAGLAVLAPPLGERINHWPVLASNLLARALRRSRALAADAAIASIVGLEERLLILLWQLAERWGETGAEGVRIGVRLPHRLLAELLGARRPSVTTALASLQDDGLVAVVEDGWLTLAGDPPC